jgi:hypothetical protein
MKEAVKYLGYVAAVLLGILIARLSFSGIISNQGSVKIGDSNPDDFTNITALHVIGDFTASGTARFGGAITITASTTLVTTTVGNLFQGNYVNSIATSSATYSLSAAEVCNSSVISVAPSAAAVTVTLPATSTLLAACITSTGSFKDLNWLSVSTSSVVAAGAGGTLNYSSSATVAAGKSAILRIIHDSSLTYRAVLINAPN